MTVKPKTITLKLTSTTKNSSRTAFTKGSDKSPAKPPKALKSIDRGSKVDIITGKEPTVHGASGNGKRRREEEDIEVDKQKRLKIGKTSSERKSSPCPKSLGRRVRQRAAGLRNVSNTCYYNAALQTLVQTEPVRELCLATAEKLANAIADNVVVGKHTTRRSSREQSQIVSLFEHVHPDDV